MYQSCFQYFRTSTGLRRFEEQQFKYFVVLSLVFAKLCKSKRKTSFGTFIVKEVIGNTMLIHNSRHSFGPWSQQPICSDISHHFKDKLPIHVVMEIQIQAAFIWKSAKGVC